MYEKSPEHGGLKITEKVTFNIASEASYIFSGQKLIKNAKIGQNPKLKVKKVLPDRSILNDKKFIENDKIEKTQMRHFESFSNIVYVWTQFAISQFSFPLNDFSERSAYMS